MSESYDLIVIGAGAAGLTAAGFSGKAGAKVALIERESLGGDCTWTGCVPSKTLLKVAKVAHTARTASQYGITTSAPTVDMKAIRAHIQQVVQEIYQHETPEVFGSEYRVEVIKGEARFADAHTVQVGDQRLTAKKFVIATGASPAIPPVPGLDAMDYKTNRDIFDNERLPEHLLVMGAGPVGTEIAQAYARLGASVTLIDVALLPRDEPEVAAVLEPILQAEGVRFVPTLVDSAQQDGDQITLQLRNGETVTGDMLFVAVGRAPNVRDLWLENADVRYSDQGIPVDQSLRTNVPHIYAVGDCTTGPKFTHYAGFQGSIAGRNAILPLVNSSGHEAINPWVTFTDPEVAHVGLTEAEAREQYGAKVKTYLFSLRHGDRAVTEGDTDGFIKITYRGSGKLLGVTIVAARAGEMITEFALAMKQGFGLGGITGTIHPYPSYSDIVKKAASSLTIQELLQGPAGTALGVASKVLWRR